jgi:hypothetical protein
MVCGTVKSTVTGATGSACVWATSTDWAIVEYIQAGTVGIYPNLPATTVKLRNGMEQPAM